MIFQILQIRSTLKEVKENPGHFASSQIRDLILGIVILPVIIVFLGLAFLFALGFMKFLGGPYFLFKIIFFIGLLVSFILGSIIYKVTSVLRDTTKRVVNTTIDNVRNPEPPNAPNL